MSNNEKMHSEQSFGLDINYCISLLELIKSGKKTIKDLQKAKTIGPNKIETFGYWLRIIDLANYNESKFELTEFGNTILNIKNNNEYVSALLLYKLSKGWNNGGHFYFSKLINNILYEKAFSLDNVISSNEIKQKIVHYSYENNVAENRMKKFVIQNINTLTDPINGFGKLGMVIKQKGQYAIYSYWPDPLICAYLLYDFWEGKRIAIKINTIAKDKFNLGRIFYLDTDRVLSILDELKKDEWISIETSAGLNQIRLNPNLTKFDVLEEIQKYG